jgi:FAD:protein FMN transferase
VIKSFNITQFIIDAGGDILYHGDETLEVALENPLNIDEAIGIAKIKNQSICGSAGNRRAWQGFHHIIKNILATWAVADDGLIADALTTALFFTEPQSLCPHFNFEYLVLYKDQSVLKSPNFPAELFLN